MGKNKQLLSKMSQRMISEFSTSHTDLMGGQRSARSLSPMYSKFEGKVEGKIIGKFSKSFANVEEYSRGYSEELKENNPSGNGRGRSTN